MQTGEKSDQPLASKTQAADSESFAKGQQKPCLSGNLVHWLPGETLADVERYAVIACLEYYQWNRTKTTNALQISIRTLRNWIEKWKEQGYEIPGGQS